MPPDFSDGLTRRRLGGLSVVLASRLTLAEQMRQDCEAARSGPGTYPRLVFSANGHSLAMNHAAPDFAALLAAADIIHADGQPLVLYSRLFGKRAIPERSATTDFFHDAAQLAVREGLRFYFLGADRQTSEMAVAAVRQQYPGLIIAGARDGYFPDEEFTKVAAEVRATRPDVVWVGLGRPKQERFCVLMRDHMAGVGWLKTCGGLFGHLAGAEQRAPRWMQSVGLEWLYRLVQD
ncbi:MAG: WecB/TagA/CpsF family glycosyltransferase, partial [Rhodospirillales bacterium]